ncbi:MAG: DEAD/DEAH box helicase, partial [Candidatus Hodarchaeota archaeon]
MKIIDLAIPPPIKDVLIKSGINELYPPQEEAIKEGVLAGKNLVLATPTASGKTLIAELCALKQICQQGGKVIYLTPLRALSSEKFQEFKKYSTIKRKDEKRIKIGISTGDYDSSDPWMGRYDIIITTNEKADSLLRHRTKWMDEISLVIADEVHLLNNAERGPTLEVVLSRLKQINPRIQILALSATIKNVGEIADWLKADYIATEWRPILLREGVLLQDEVQFKDGASKKIHEETRKPIINWVLDTIKA